MWKALAYVCSTSTISLTDIVLCLLITANRCASNIWEDVGDDIKRLLIKHKGYKLVLTGHSLGKYVLSIIYICLHILCIKRAMLSMQL
jgi:Lipase (class 3)